MTNKEKLEIIERQLDLWYKILEPETLDDRANVISQTIYNLESTKLLLENEIEFIAESQERIDENLPPFIEENTEEIEDDDFSIEVKPTIYVCPVCKKEAFIYGDMVDGKCLKCNQKLVKKED